MPFLAMCTVAMNLVTNQELATTYAEKTWTCVRQDHVPVKMFNVLRWQKERREALKRLRVRNSKIKGLG